MKVQPGRRLVQNEQRVVARLLGQFGRQLHALCLATAERRALLTELEIAQADLRERRARIANLGKRSKKSHRLIDSHAEHVGDVAALVMNLERLAIVSPPVARLTRHVNRRQKVHFDFQHPAALAFLASPALDIKAEPARSVPANLRRRQTGKQVADLIEDAGVRRRVAARRPADRRLVHDDYLPQRLLATQRLELAGPILRVVKIAEQRPPKHAVDQRAFARATDAGHARDRPQRDFQMDVLQIILRSTNDLEEAAGNIRADATGRHVDLVVAPQIFRSQRFFVSEHFFNWPGRHHFPAVQSGTRPHVDDVISPSNGLLVVLNHEHRVAQIAQPLKCGEQLLVVPRVQADTRLVENVQHAHKPSADLCSQANALCLPAA